jgi:hypothetical protein
MDAYNRTKNITLMNTNVLQHRRKFIAGLLPTHETIATSSSVNLDISKPRK